VLNELRLRAEKCLQDGAGQRCVVPMTSKVLDALFLVEDALLTAQYVALGLLQMLKLAEPIQFALLPI